MRALRLLAITAVSGALGALAATSAVAEPTRAQPEGTNLAPVKTYLLEHTALLQGFTKDFQKLADRYYALAKGAGFDYPAMWAAKRGQVAPLVRSLKAEWIDGNPLYERVEGIVAGTPSLSAYDVIIDAGSSYAEDPASAVPFDLDLPDGRVLRKPGNFYNVTEGLLWGTLPVAKGVRADLDRDGKVEFGEVLPDANVLKAAADGFVVYAGKLDRSARAWTPTPSDAFTAVVVMVPTMTEYFGQWKVSRFVLGDRAKGEAFNVVSRLSDIGDILGGLRVIYAGIGPAIAKVDKQQSQQTKRELDALWGFIGKLRTQESAGRRFSPQVADSLGRTAQERGTSVAGQVTQAAARLKVKIVQ